MVQDKVSTLEVHIWLKRGRLNWLGFYSGDASSVLGNTFK